MEEKEEENEIEEGFGFDAVNLDTIFSRAEMEFDFDVTLPPHQRCTSHILNLVGSKDGLAVVKNHTGFCKIYDAYVSKRRVWLRMQNKSTTVAEVLHANLGQYLKVPIMVRWNSEYDLCHQVRSSELK